MKKGFALILQLLILVLGCSEPDADPAQLYKTWQRTGSLTDGKPDTGFLDTQELIVQFRPDGKLLYGTDKSEGGCCRYGRFIQEDGTLIFSFQTVTGGCANVRCAPSPFYSLKPWKIQVLRANQLIIISEDKVISFRSY